MASLASLSPSKGSTFIFREENHHQDSCEQLEELWLQKTLCDVNLIAENAEGEATISVPAHRVVLAANIPYFKAMLTSAMQESKLRDVTLRNVDGEGLKRVVGYAYSGSIEISESTAQGVLTTASLFGLPRIVSACAKFMTKHITVVNCLGIREFSRLHELSDLSFAANKFAMSNFSKVWKAEEFLGLAVEEVEDFVRSDQINVNSEEDVYEAVTRWIKSSPEERREHSDRLYAHVRLPILPLNFIKSVVKQNELITGSKMGEIMLREAMDYHDNPASVILFSNPRKIQPRSSVMGVICVVGGAGDGGESLNDVTFFSPHKMQWRPGTKMLQHRSRLALALFNGELYAIGGSDLSETLSSVEKYSPLTNTWRKVTSLNTPRRSCAAVVTPQAIYALGGYSGSVFLKSVEMYDPILDEWTYQPAMTETRSELAAVFFDQRIYAIGGFNSQNQLRSVERFDLINRQWEKIADMCAPRANAAAALLGQEIFITGGQVEKEVINIAEVYNPELNQWEHLAARMEHPRVGLTVVAIGNMIYAIGGSNGSEYLDSVECYDPSKLKWVPAVSLPSPRFAAAAVVLLKSDRFVPMSP